MKLFFFISLHAAVVLAERFHYDGYKVYDLTASTHEDIEFLNDLMLTDSNLDFWEEPNHSGASTVMIAPEFQEQFIDVLSSTGIEVEVRHEDLSRIVRASWEEYDQRKMSQRDVGAMYDLNDFNTFAEIENYLDDVINVLCPASNLTCTQVNLGNSPEGNPIWKLRIGTSVVEKQSFWIDSTIHAREWLAPATALKVLNHLVTEYGSDPEVTDILNAFDWHVVPVFNPDGYIYTQTERYWRKNRTPNAGSSCIGTDLNRNHAYKWGRRGASSNPCSNTYRGSGPASETETQVVQNGILQVLQTSDIRVLMSFHSYGNYWVHPWGNTIYFFFCEIPSDYADLYALAEPVAQAIQAVYNTSWSWGSSCQVIYPTSGTTDDWAKGVAGIKYTITPELRGNDFVIAPSEIQPSFQEIWAGLATQAQILGV